MSNSKKMTKRDYFSAILSKYPLTEDEKAFVEHELELLAKKNSAEKKPTAQQLANQSTQEAILNFMQIDTLYTITDIIKGCEACNDLTNQRVSALVRQLMPDHIERVEDKRKAYFRKIAD